MVLIFSNGHIGSLTAKIFLQRFYSPEWKEVLILFCRNGKRYYRAKAGREALRKSKEELELRAGQAPLSCNKQMSVFRLSLRSEKNRREADAACGKG